MIGEGRRRPRELGRIRLGRVVAATKANGDPTTRPAKLDRLRFTSSARPLLDRVAALYGGTVDEWTPANGGPAQWEVITDATRVPVMVPPASLSQWMEQWSGSVCRRRCDGTTELLSDSPCLCAAADERVCKPTTRLNLVLVDVPGVGVWRLESHGWYAAAELPAVVELLEHAGGYVDATLTLEERTVRREVDGKVTTHRFMVPALEVDVTPRQLLTGEISPTHALTASAAAELEAAPASDQATSRLQEVASSEPAGGWRAAAAAVDHVDRLRSLWRAADRAGVLTADPDLRAALEQRAAELTPEAS